MKLGIINGWSEGCFEYVHNKGLEAVEFCVNESYNSADFLSNINPVIPFFTILGLPPKSLTIAGIPKLNPSDIERLDVSVPVEQFILRSKIFIYSAALSINPVNITLC